MFRVENILRFRIFLRKILLLFFFLLTTLSFRAQISQFYLDGCYNYDYFSNLQSFDTEKPQKSWGFRFGLGVLSWDSSKVRLNTEIGFSRRILIQAFPNINYKHTFNGLDWSVLIEYQPIKPIWLEAGFGLSLYIRTFEYEDKGAGLADGFRNYDLFLNGGINIQVYKFIFLGSRVRYGLIPQLNYTPIGEYGGFEEDKNIINVLTHEIYLRIKILDQ